MNEYVNPHDTDLEEAVIGACLIESKAITLVDDKLCPEVFYEEKNREIYAAIQSMYRAGRSIDVITVKEELAQRGRLDAVGGPYTVMRISSRVASSAHLEYHAEILKQKYIRREMILGCNKLLALACDESTDITDTLVDAHSLLDRLENEYGTTDHLRSMEQLMKDTVGQVETRVASNRDGVTGIPTGFTDLNRMTAGWQPGDEVIIAARPSVGKTAFALHLARTAATAGHQVLVYSLEMQGERLGDRWLLAACPGGQRRTSAYRTTQPYRTAPCARNLRRTGETADIHRRQRLGKYGLHPLLRQATAKQGAMCPYHHRLPATLRHEDRTA